MRWEHPNENDVKVFAEAAGMDIGIDAEFVWMIQKALKDSMPSGWLQRTDPNDKLYFVENEGEHNEVSTWNHPRIRELQLKINGIMKQRREDEAARMHLPRHRTDKSIPIPISEDVSKQLKFEAVKAAALEAALYYYKDMFGNPEVDDIEPDTKSKEWWSVTPEDMYSLASQLLVDLDLPANEAALWVVRFGAGVINTSLPPLWTKTTIGASAGSSRIDYAVTGWKYKQCINHHPILEFLRILIRQALKEAEHMTPRFGESEINVFYDKVFEVRIKHDFKTGRREFLETPKTLLPKPAVVVEVPSTDATVSTPQSSSLTSGEKDVTSSDVTLESPEKGVVRRRSSLSIVKIDGATDGERARKKPKPLRLSLMLENPFGVDVPETPSSSLWKRLQMKSTRTVSKSEIQQFAKDINVTFDVDTPSQSPFLDIVEEGMSEGLPPCWLYCINPEEKAHYYNTETTEASWSHPKAEYYKGLVVKAKKDREWKATVSRIAGRQSQTEEQIKSVGQRKRSSVFSPIVKRMCPVCHQSLLEHNDDVCKPSNPKAVEDKMISYTGVMGQASDFYSVLYGDYRMLELVEMRWKTSMPSMTTPSEHVTRAAAYLGINTVTETDMFWIARLALTAPMAPDWELTSATNAIQFCNGKSTLCIHRIGLCSRSTVAKYHKHKSSGLCIRAHPSDPYFLQVINKWRERAAKFSSSVVMSSSKEVVSSLTGEMLHGKVVDLEDSRRIRLPHIDTGESATSRVREEWLGAKDENGTAFYFNLKTSSFSNKAPDGSEIAASPVNIVSTLNDDGTNVGTVSWETGFSMPSSPSPIAREHEMAKRGSEISIRRSSISSRDGFFKSFASRDTSDFPDSDSDRSGGEDTEDMASLLVDVTADEHKNPDIVQSAPALVDTEKDGEVSDPSKLSSSIRITTLELAMVAHPSTPLDRRLSSAASSGVAMYAREVGTPVDIIGRDTSSPPLTGKQTDELKMSVKKALEQIEERTGASRRGGGYSLHVNDVARPSSVVSMAPPSTAVRVRYSMKSTRVAPSRGKPVRASSKLKTKTNMTLTKPALALPPLRTGYINPGLTLSGNPANIRERTLEEMTPTTLVRNPETGIHLVPEWMLQQERNFKEALTESHKLVVLSTVEEKGEIQYIIDVGENIVDVRGGHSSSLTAKWIPPVGSVSFTEVNSSSHALGPSASSESLPNIKGVPRGSVPYTIGSMPPLKRHVGTSSRSSSRGGVASRQGISKQRKSGDLVGTASNDYPYYASRKPSDISTKISTTATIETREVPIVNLFSSSERRPVSQ